MKSQRNRSSHQVEELSTCSSTAETRTSFRQFTSHSATMRNFSSCRSCMVLIPCTMPNGLKLKPLSLLGSVRQQNALPSQPSTSESSVLWGNTLSIRSCFLEKLAWCSSIMQTWYNHVHSVSVDGAVHVAHIESCGNVQHEALETKAEKEDHHRKDYIPCLAVSRLWMQSECHSHQTRPGIQQPYK